MKDSTDTSPAAGVDLLRGLVVGIDHVAIAVEDLDASIRWYADNFGFTLVEKRRTEGKTTAMLSAVMAAGGAVVVLVQGTTPESQVSRFIEHFGPGVQHVAFEVSDLKAAVERLAKRQGAAADTGMIHGKGISQVFLRRDPGSGVRVELIEKRGGTFSDATVGQLFEEFESRDLY